MFKAWEDEDHRLVAWIVVAIAVVVMEVVACIQWSTVTITKAHIEAGEEQVFVPGNPNPVWQKPHP